jgi:hypothetical protein
MNCHVRPWFLSKFELCFVEDAIFGNEYFVSNFIIVIYAIFVLV